jgi:enoyl-CoA hydratase/carnithine racemase
VTDPVTDVLVREQRGAILVVRLNRPEVRNALNGALMEQIGQALLDAEADPGIRAVVLTGTGDRAFCAGLDLRDFAQGRQAAGGPAMDRFRQFLDGTPGVPVIGAVNAAAMAGGMELLLSCDMVVVSSEAKLGLPEVKRGLIPGGGGTFLASRIPLALAMEMVLTGDTIDAERAYQMGLVNAVVTPDGVLDAALALAERVAGNGPLAVVAAKELVRLSIEDHLRARARLAELVQSVFASDDAKEGASAFVQKRTPVWTGR